MRVGGVKWDAPEGWIEKVREFVPYMREQLKGYHELVTGNEIFLNRVKGVGTYTKEDALQYSLSGANLRCTGVKWDLRKMNHIRFMIDLTLKYLCRKAAMPGPATMFGWRKLKNLKNC